MSLNLEDIAKLAGVSRSTVSRVINHHPNVSDNTREKVLQIIEEQNFRPNLAARTLVTQRTQVIGIIVPRAVEVFNPYYFPLLLQGIADTTYDRGYATLMWWGQEGRGDEHFAKRLLQKNWLMDGLVKAASLIDETMVERIVEMNTPFVMVERPTRFTDLISYVTVDNVQGARTAVEHLIGLGRRRIGHLAGMLNNIDAVDRLEGYRQALEAHNLPYDPSLIGEGQFNRRTGYSAMKQLLTQDVDAVFAGNDDSALGAMQAMREAGVCIPDDIAIVGFDDLHPGEELTPQLTTIHQPIYEKGATATSLLVDMIEGVQEGPRQIVLPTHLVIRQSCGARQT
jgi:LacI family transcriptional regulator